MTAIHPPASLRPVAKVSSKKKKSGSSSASSASSSASSTTATSSSAPSTPSPFTLSHATLWEAIIASVKEKFNYELPKTFTISANQVAFLRAICQKVGIQVEARDYDFDLEAPFAYTDIVDLFPIVKHINPKSADAQDLQDAGKAMLNQGRLDMASELLSEGLAIVQQVHGPLHQDAAVLESNLAMVRYSIQDLASAIAHQSRAVVINERVLGLDHHDTAHAYLYGNLALFCQQAGKSREALGFITRALYLSNLVGGALHPDHGSTYTNVAQLLQDLDNTALAVEYLKEALKSNEILFGKGHVITANSCHFIALAYNRLGQYKDAMSFQKRCFTILSETVGENDARTKEANKWLNQFTSRAVQKQIEIKNTVQPKQQKREVITPASSSSNSNNNIGSLPLSEVLRFINTPSRGKRGGIIKLSGGTKPAAAAVVDNTEVAKKAKKKKAKKPAESQDNKQ